MLVYFEDYTDSSTSEVSAIFTWRGVGYAVGTVVSGVLYDHVNPFVVMSFVCVVSASFQFITPLFDSIIVVYTLSGFHAFFLAYFLVGRLIISIYVTSDFVLWFWVGEGGGATQQTQKYYDLSLDVDS